MASRYSKSSPIRRTPSKAKVLDLNPPQRGKGSPNGYNSSRWNSPYAVRKGLRNLGYAIEVGNQPLVGNPAVRSFQRDYNRMHKKYPYRAPGRLVVDGTAGKHTLNGMDWAIAFGKSMPNSWIYYVKKHRAAGVYA